MERFNALGRGMQLMLVGTVLLLVSTFFAWQDFGDAGVITRNAWHGIGVVMGLLAIVLLAWIVARLAAVEIPIPLSSAMIGGVLAFLIFIFALLFNLTDDYSTFMSYVGLVFAGLIAVGAWLQIQESGGIESLKQEATSLGSGSSGAAAAPSADAPAAAAPPPSAAPPADAPEPAAEPEPPAPADENA
jgi:hypothetical protein